MKKCSVCHEIKDISLFVKNRKQCKTCYSIRNKQYYKNNKEKILARCEKNHEKRNTYSKIYKLKNKTKIKEQSKEYRSKNKEKINTQGRIWYKNNKKIIAIKKKKYYQNNKNKINERAKNKMHNDPIFKLRIGFSRRINKQLKRNISNKNNKSCLKYVNYSIQELKQYLESLFEPWMNWNNYGFYNSKTWNEQDSLTWTWSIDHIIPQSNLPFDSMEHPNFQKCWALENLRPYSAKQNLLDGTNRIRHKKKIQ